MPKFVRARPGAGVMVHPETGAVAAPDPTRPYRSDDPLVKAFPDAFVSDEELYAELEQQESSWRESAIEAARRADVQNAERAKAAEEQDADAVKMAEARAAGTPQGDDADPTIKRGITVDDDVEDATSRPGQKSNARKK